MEGGKTKKDRRREGREEREILISDYVTGGNEDNFKNDKLFSLSEKETIVRKSDSLNVCVEVIFFELFLCHQVE